MKERLELTVTDRRDASRAAERRPVDQLDKPSVRLITSFIMRKHRRQGVTPRGPEQHKEHFTRLVYLAYCMMSAAAPLLAST